MRMYPILFSQISLFHVCFTQQYNIAVATESSRGSRAQAGACHAPRRAPPCRRSRVRRVPRAHDDYAYTRTDYCVFFEIQGPALWVKQLEY